jgi:LuxR family transcriptional regulator, maltose regulon positive regulatory protein
MERMGGAAIGAQQRAPERFPFTKFVPPLLDARVVTERVVERLDAAIGSRSLTLLIAPAGSGKTTALAAWAEATADDVVWVRLDADDAEPAVLAAALLDGGRHQLGHGFGGRLAHLLAYTGAVPTPRQLVTSLVNDLGDRGPVTLLLDDVHAVSGAGAVAFLEDLLDHLPPDARVVLASRVEPALSLVRRRVRGELAELGLDDLRLDRDAVRRVLAHETAASDEQVDAVLATSGGWPAAVRLATAHVGPDASRLLGTTPRAATDVLADLHPFLDEEVLAALPQRLQTFLLETSILDELTPVVCDTVTGRSDSERMLAEADRRNLFVTRHRAEAGDTWRTHDLFTAFLREQLGARYDADAIRELHRRAAGVLPPLLSLPHLLASADHATAAKRVVQLGLENMDASMVRRLAPTIRALPPEIRAADHLLSLLLVLPAQVAGDAHEAASELEPLRDRLLAAGDHVAAAEVNCSLMDSYLALGDLDAAGAALQQALSQTGEPWLRPGALASGTWWCYFRNDWDGVSRYNEEALRLVLSSGDPSLYKVVAPGLSPLLLFADRGPTWMADAVDRLTAGLHEEDRATLTALRPVRAGAALLRLDIANATAELRQCLAESMGYGRMAWKHQEAEGLLMAICLGTGDLATVQTILDDAVPRLDAPIYRQYRHLYAYAALRAHWLAEEHRDLVAAYERLMAAEPRSGQAADTVVRAVAQGMLARIEGRTGDALEVLERGERAQRDGRCWLWVGLPGLDRASILLEDGRVAAAIEAALPTLEVAADIGPGILFPEARTNGAVLERCRRAGIHADLIRSVLAASQPDDHVREPVAIPGTGEVLSGRELEVLAQVAAGASNREIARALFIGEATVKSHLTRILRKLDASSRTHAVARARELRLL